MRKQEKMVTGPLVVGIRVRSVVRVLVAMIILIGVAGVLAYAIGSVGSLTGFRPTLDRFNLDGEASVAAWFSGGVLLLCAGVLALLAGGADHAADAQRRSWWLLALLFGAMSVDEVVSFHELLIGRLRGLMNAGGIFYFAWVIPASLLVAVLALSLIPFLRSLPRKTAVRFLVAGTFFVAGALGLEMVAGWHVQRHTFENLTYFVMATVEELLEMVGATLFLRALLLYLSQVAGTVQLVLVDLTPSPTDLGMPTDAPGTRPES